MCRAWGALCGRLAADAQAPLVKMGGARTLQWDRRELAGRPVSTEVRLALDVQARGVSFHTVTHSRVCGHEVTSDPNL